MKLIRKISLFLIVFGCTMTTKTDTFITENFDCFELKSELGYGIIDYDLHKNMLHFSKNELASLSEVEAANFINYYPDAAPFYDYYPFSAFISEDKKLEVILFCEHDASEEKNNFMIQTLYNKKPVAKFNLTEVFGLKKVDEFDGGVNIAKGFENLDKSNSSFSIRVFRKPKGTNDDFGSIKIKETGEINLFTGSGLP